MQQPLTNAAELSSSLENEVCIDKVLKKRAASPDHTRNPKAIKLDSTLKEPSKEQQVSGFKIQANAAELQDSIQGVIDTVNI